MPIRNSQKTLLRDFSGGVVSLIDSAFTAINLNFNQLLKSQNAFWRAGLQKRKGMVKVSPVQVNGAKPVLALHRFYRKAESKQFLAASGGTVARLNETTGAWTVIKAGFNSSSRINMTTYGPTERVLISDGASLPQSWDGTIISNYSDAPAGTKEFIVHRERVFAYGNNVSISYSDNLDPDTWNAASLTLGSNDPTITKGIVHTQSTSNTSVVSQLLFFTANSVWVLAGNDFVGLTDVVLEELSGQVGTSSPNSVVKTPKGVVFFGRQQGKNNVFIVVGEGLGARIIPIGDSIRRELEKIPASGMEKVTATYFDGYYRLSIRSPGNQDNKVEWWLWMDGTTFSWFGSMNRSVGMQSLLPLSGSNDNNVLYGGGEDGYVYQLDKSNDDDGVIIPVDIQTGFHDFGFFSQQKQMIDAYILAQAGGGSLDVSINSDFQPLASETKKSLSLVAAGGVFPYTFPFTFPTTPPSINTLEFSSSKIVGTYISIRVEFNVINEGFILNSLGLKYKITEQDNREA